MRGRADHQLPLFHTFEVEDRVRAVHPLRSRSNDLPIASSVLTTSHG